ncbi:MAG: hypothetical protein H6711_26870 [Myxococcales bacterium]|nr:hypothetical protein [Myxococcales bacterium]
MSAEPEAAVCRYVCDGSARYLAMLGESLRGLRAHNPALTVEVTLVEHAVDEAALDRLLALARRLEVRVRRRPPLAAAAGYFPLHKAYATRPVRERVLLLDADTFVLGSLAPILEGCVEAAIYAVEGRWVYGAPSWRPGLLGGAPPLNSGVVLFNRRSIACWRPIPSCRSLASGAHPEVMRLLLELHPEAYHREELSLSLAASQAGLEARGFERALVGMYDREPPRPAECRIFHSFGHNWGLVYELLHGRPPPPPIELLEARA